MGGEAPRTSGGCWKYGCLAMIVMFAGGIGIAVVTGMRSRNEADPVVERYFANVDAGAYADEYALASSALRASRTAGQFAAETARVRAALGAFRSRSFEGISVNARTGGTTVEAAYRCVFERGEARVRFVLVEEGGELRVQLVAYDSPLLGAGGACPGCGAGVKPGDAFCAACGARIPEPPPPPPARPTDPGGTAQEF